MKENSGAEKILNSLLFKGFKITLFHCVKIKKKKKKRRK